MRALILAVCSLVLGAWLALWLRRVAERSAGRARQLQGERGERDAERLLEANGYRVRERKVRTAYEIMVDGSPARVPLVLDLIAERDGRTFVVEVKTGAAANLWSQGTRRQLLEYQLATGASDVLLVDADAQRITCVAFPVARAVPVARTSALLLAAAACVAAVALWWLRTR